MKYLRYKGAFVSIGGHVIRAEIWQEAEAPFVSIGELTFDADCPIQIEWQEKAKEEVICGSTATIKVISPGDRTYEDLYTIEPGRVQLKVYKDDVMYWSGTIDTEFYEEPYEQAKDYTVELTFSDFGILNRMECTLTGMLTIGDIVRHCMDKMQTKDEDTDTSMISTSMKTGGAAITTEDIKVSAANFYDEDGEAMTLTEVLEGILQPLGLKIMQRCGKMYIYDLNGMYTKALSTAIAWNGDTQTMSTDKVYSNARVTWSPYVSSGNIWPERAWGFIKTDANKTALDKADGITEGDATYYTFHASTDTKIWPAGKDPGFTLWTSDKGENAKLMHPTLKFFKIVPQLNGAEEQGIAITFKSCIMDKLGGTPFPVAQTKVIGFPWAQLGGTTSGTGSMLFEGKKTWLSPVPDEKGLILRVNLDMLMDPRTNFYEEAVNYSKSMETLEKDYMDACKRDANVVYVPVMIKFRPSGTGDIYVWDNRNIVKRTIENEVNLLSDTYGSWVLSKPDGGLPDVWGWLAYYDAADRDTNTGITGWQSNRPAINPHKGTLTSILEKSDSGQYIPYPNFGGKGGDIWMEVYSGGWMVCNGGDAIPSSGQTPNVDIWKNNAWVMVKLPKLEILNNVQFDRELDTDDVEYKGTLNKYAKDPIEIDTVCGTAEGGVATARGAYYDADGKQITTLTRAGRTSQAEDLLIGTLYSQYAERHVMLQGDAELLMTGLTAYTEPNQEGKKFICTADIQDLRAETSEATIVELRPDEYKKTEE